MHISHTHTHKHTHTHTVFRWTMVCAQSGSLVRSGAVTLRRPLAVTSISSSFSFPTRRSPHRHHHRSYALERHLLVASPEHVKKSTSFHLAKANILSRHCTLQNFLDIKFIAKPYFFVTVRLLLPSALFTRLYFFVCARAAYRPCYFFFASALLKRVCVSFFCHVLVLLLNSLTS